MEIRLEACDGRVDLFVILSENGSVAGEQPFDVASTNPAQGCDEIWNTAAMMGINRTDAAIAEEVISRKKEIAKSERKLSIGVSGSMPYFKLQFANANPISVINLPFDFHRWHVEKDSLGGNFGISRQFFASFKITGGGRVARDHGFEDLFGPGEPLNVINIRVRGDQRDTF